MTGFETASEITIPSCMGNLRDLDERWNPLHENLCLEGHFGNGIINGKDS